MQNDKNGHNEGAQNQKSSFREVVERVREANSIVEVVKESGVRLNQVGNNLAGLCIFHNDHKKPNLTVFPDTQSFHCFACGEGGDVFEFVMQEKGLNFANTLKLLAERAGVTASWDGSDQQDEQDRRALEAVLYEAALLYHKNLPDHIRKYLKGERGLTDETIDENLLGFCDGKTQFKADKDKLVKIGLLYESGEEYLKGFITFPYFHNGRVVNMTGRGYPEKLHKKLPKEKVELTFPYRGNTRRKGLPILVEGEIDTLTLRQAGLNAYGIPGVTSFKKEWTEYFKKFEMVYVCFDGDKAGKEGAWKVAEQIGPVAQIVALPEGQDINDYFKNATAEDYKDLLYKKKTLIECKIADIPSNTPKIELARVLDPILKELAQMQEHVSHMVLTETIKNHFGLKNKDIDSFEKAVNRYRGELEEEEGNETHPTVQYTMDFDGLVDVVQQDGQPAFLIKDKEHLKVVRSVERDGVVYIPPPTEKIPWLLPRASEVLKRYTSDNDRKLYDDLVEYHREISWLPMDEHYDLLASWVIHTYLQEAIQYSPGIYMFAVQERGKSRTGKGIIYVAYRGIRVQELREANLLRYARDYKATLFFDQMNVWKKAEKMNCEDILLNRYEQGGYVSRVLHPERGAFHDMETFQVFGATVIATNVTVHQIMESRTIQIQMPGTTKKFENEVLPENSLPLKERLVAFRARHLGESLPNVDKPSSARFGDILKPLYQVVHLVRPERKQVFLKLIEMLEEDRLVEKTETLEAQLLKAIVALSDEVAKGILPVKKITEKYNFGKLDRMKITDSKVGKQLSSLGFSKERTKNGASAIRWDDALIKRLKAAYGLDGELDFSDDAETNTAPNPPPETPLEPPNIEDLSDGDDFIESTSL